MLSFFIFGSLWRSVYFQLAFFYTCSHSFCLRFHRLNFGFRLEYDYFQFNKNCRHKVVAHIYPSLCSMNLLFKTTLCGFDAQQTHKEKLAQSHFQPSFNYFVCVFDTIHRRFNTKPNHVAVNRSNIFSSLSLALTHFPCIPAQEKEIAIFAKCSF